MNGNGDQEHGQKGHQGEQQVDAHHCPHRQQHKDADADQIEDTSEELVDGINIITKTTDRFSVRSGCCLRIRSLQKLLQQISAHHTIDQIEIEQLTRCQRNIGRLSPHGRHDIQSNQRPQP